jgi:Na+-driven multidrug efflux pump
VSAGGRVGSESGPTAELLRLTWPAALSFLLGSAYRINDQFWIQGLGESAQSATAAVLFVAIMNFSAAILAAGGALSLVARSIGAQDIHRAHRVARHAVGFAIALGALFSVVGPWLTPGIISLLGVSGETATLAEDYLGTLFLTSIPLFLAPTLDNVFIGRGQTRVPMFLQLSAIGLNYLLNPLMIYGSQADVAMAGVPGAAFAAGVAERFGIEGLGISGAAWATGLSRTITGCVGLFLMRAMYGTSLRPAPRMDGRLLRSLVRISYPVSLSIALYAGVYWVMLGLVFSELSDAVRAGFGIGFQVFDGLAYPLFLGLGVAASTLVGRELGADRVDRADLVVRSARRVAWALGATLALLFWVLAEPVGRQFTDEPAVLQHVVLYVNVLACSQLFVAIEALEEKILLGAGTTRSIPIISAIGNGLRIPATYVLGLTLGLGPLGVWWAINASTLLKAYLFWRQVQRGDWRRATGVEAP